MYSAVELLDEERENKKISREKLVRGVCTQQHLAKSALGEKEMELMVFELLMERLGHSTDDFEYIMSRQIYEKIKLVDDIEDAILLTDLQRATRLLNEYLEKYGIETPIDEMYYYRMKAELTVAESEDSDSLLKAKEYILKAIYATMPGITRENYRDYLFSTYEGENFLMYVKILAKAGDAEKSADVLREFFDFYSSIINDKALLARILPKCAIVMFECCEGVLSDEELEDYGEKAFFYLRDEDILYGMEPLLKGLYEVNCRLKDEKKAEEMKEYLIFVQEILKEYGAGMVQDGIFFRWRVTSFMLDYEVIRGERQNRGMTQADLADGIYGNEFNVSRIENKKATPNKTKFKEIMDKLDLDKVRCGGFVSTMNFKQLDWISEVRELLSKGKWEEALKFAESGKAKGEEWLRIVAAYKTMALGAENKIDNAKASKDLIDLIDETYGLDLTKYYRKPFQEENDLIAAYILRTNRVESEKVQSISGKLRDTYESSDLDMRYNFRGYAMAINCYLRYVKPQEQGFFEKCLRFAVKMGKISAVGGVIFAQRRHVDRELHPELRMKYAYVLYTEARLCNRGKKVIEAYKEEFLKYKNKISSKTTC